MATKLGKTLHEGLPINSHNMLENIITGIQFDNKYTEPEAN